MMIETEDISWNHVPTIEDRLEVFSGESQARNPEKSKSDLKQEKNIDNKHPDMVRKLHRMFYPVLGSPVLDTNPLETKKEKAGWEN